MNNRITLFLQDKDLINELIKDPDVQLRIKDAVLDQIARRAIRLSSLGDTVIRKAKDEIESTYLERTGYWNTTELKAEYKEKIRQEAKIAFEQLVKDELEEMRAEIRIELRKKKEEIINALKMCNTESIIREAAEKIVREKFK